LGASQNGIGLVGNGLQKADLLPIVLQECERMAGAYAEEKDISSGKAVSILIIFF